MQTVLATSKVIAGYQLLAHGLQSTLPVLGPEILLLLSITDFQTESFGFYKTSKFDVVQWCVKVYQSQTAGFSNIPFLGDMKVFLCFWINRPGLFIEKSEEKY